MKIENVIMEICPDFHSMPADEQEIVKTQALEIIRLHK